MKLGKGVNELSFDGSDTPQRNRNNPPDILRAIPVKLYVKDGKTFTVNLPQSSIGGNFYNEMLRSRDMKTKSLIQSQNFKVSLPNPQTLSHKSSFIPKACNLWNVLSSSPFPESYNLPFSKSKINKLDLISRSS